MCTKTTRAGVSSSSMVSRDGLKVIDLVPSLRGYVDLLGWETHCGFACTCTVSLAARTLGRLVVTSGLRSPLQYL